MKTPSQIVPLIQFRKLLTAVYRSDIADFLCLLVWDDKGVFNLILFLRITGRCGISARITGCTVSQLRSTVPHFNSNKTYKKMEHIDLTAYLVDVFNNSECVINPESTEFDGDRFLKSLEIWWKRQNESTQAPTAPVAHLTLSLINIATALMAEKMDGVDLFQQRNRLIRIKSQLIQSMAKHLPQCEPQPAQNAA